jgi:hypothetical protein
MSAADIRLRFVIELCQGLLRNVGVGRSTDCSNGSRSSFLLMSAWTAICEAEMQHSQELDEASRSEMNTSATTESTPQETSVHH